MNPTPEQHERALTMFRRGQSSFVIARRLRMDVRLVREWRAAAAKKRSRRVDRDEVRRRHMNGESEGAIAAALGCTPDTVRKIRQRLGLLLDNVSPEGRARMNEKLRVMAAEQREAILLGDPEPKWARLLGPLAGRAFDGEDPGDGGPFRQPRQDSAEGLYASSMAYA